MCVCVLAFTRNTFMSLNLCGNDFLMVKAVHSAFRFWQRSIHVSSVLHQRPPTLAYPFLLRLTNSRGQWGFHTVSHTYLTCLFFLLFCIRTALLIICTKHQSNKICIENPLVLPLAWLFMYLINLIHQKRYVCVIKTHVLYLPAPSLSWHQSSATCEGWDKTMKL